MCFIIKSCHTNNTFGFFHRKTQHSKTKRAISFQRSENSIEIICLPRFDRLYLTSPVKLESSNGNDRTDLTKQTTRTCTTIKASFSLYRYWPSHFEQNRAKRTKTYKRNIGKTRRNFKTRWDELLVNTSATKLLMK